MTDTDSDQYPFTVEWALVAHAAGADGVVWMSRQLNSVRAYCLFGDTVGASDLDPIPGDTEVRAFATPADSEWLYDIALRMRVTIPACHLAPPPRNGLAAGSHTVPEQAAGFAPVQTRYIVCVRIGAPARKHGVADADIWHAVRNATRRVKMDDDLTMLIGPALDGSLLEVGILGIDGEDAVIIHAMDLRPKFYQFLR